MIVVPPIRPYLVQPRTVALHGVAKLLLDAGMHEDSLDLAKTCSIAKQRLMRLGPAAVVHIGAFAVS